MTKSQRRARELCLLRLAEMLKPGGYPSKIGIMQALLAMSGDMTADSAIGELAHIVWNVCEAKEDERARKKS